MNASSKFLFFDLEITGHHVEYLYHLISYRISHPNCGDFILVVHPNFINCISELELTEDWESRGVSIVHPSQQEMRELQQMRSIHKKSAAEFKILRKILYRYQPEKCYLMMLNQFQYLVGSRLGRTLPCNIRGILFNPLGAPGNKEPAWFTTLRKHLQLIWMFRNQKLEHIYILNDANLVDFLNKKYNRKNFFISLPDPIFIPPKENQHKESGYIPERSNKCRFLLFGSLSARKGIFMVLNALRLISNDIANQIEVVFAGKVVSQDRKSFLEDFTGITHERLGLSIHYKDEFIPYRKIPELFLNCDCVLVPYTGNQASSGVIGHAALYGKPVIGHDCGLMGELIHTYDLGITIAAMDAEKLAMAITDFSKNKQTAIAIKPSGMKRFVEERHPTRFVETLFKK